MTLIPQKFNSDFPNALTRYGFTREMIHKFGLLHPLSLVGNEYPKECHHVFDQLVTVSSNGQQWPAYFFIDPSLPEPVFYDNGCVPTGFMTDDYQLVKCPDIHYAVEMVFSLQGDPFQYIDFEDLCDSIRFMMHEKSVFLSLGSFICMSWWCKDMIFELYHVRTGCKTNPPNVLFSVNESTRIIVKQKPKFDLSWDCFGGFHEQTNELRKMAESVFDDSKETDFQTVLLTGPRGSGHELITRILESKYCTKVYNAMVHADVTKEPVEELKKIVKEAKNNTPCILIARCMDRMFSKSPRDSKARTLAITALQLLDGLIAENCKDMLFIASTHYLHKVEPVLMRAGRMDKLIDFPTPSLEDKNAIVPLIFEKIPLKHLEHRLTNLQKLKDYLINNSKHCTAGDLVKMVSYAIAYNNTYSKAALTSAPLIIDDFKTTHQMTPSGQVYTECEQISSVTMEDIAAYDHLKLDIKKRFEIVLNKRKEMEAAKITPPKRSLWVGPPGTGKSMLVEALANEFKLNLISVRRKDVFSKYFGESEKKLDALFEKANKCAPSLLHFESFDGIAGFSDDGSEVEERVVSHLKVLLDGIIGQDKDVFVVAETNRPDNLDKNVIRPGRFHYYRHFHLPKAIDIRQAIDKWLPDTFTPELMVYAVNALAGTTIRGVKGFCKDFKVVMENPLIEGEDTSPSEARIDQVMQEVRVCRSRHSIRACNKFADSYPCDLPRRRSS